MRLKDISVKLMEGGNATALDSNGDVFQWRGEPAQAQKVDLSVFSREMVTSNFIKVFQAINQLVEKRLGEPLWTDFSIIPSGEAFNGSSEAFFDPNIKTDQYVQHKPKVGDIDIVIPREKAVDLWHVLKELEGRQITKDITYVANNRPKETSIGDQINAIFEITNGEDRVLAQVDFELAEFEADGKPTEWAKFSHSSDWADIESGFKGVVHKYLLGAISKTVGRVPNSVKLTPSSPVEDIETIEAAKKEYDAALNAVISAYSQNTNSKPVDELDAELTALFKKKASELTPEEKEIRQSLQALWKEKTAKEKALKKVTPNIPKGAEGVDLSSLTFSVIYGLRNKIRKQTTPSGKDLTVGGRTAYKEIPPAESGYINKIDGMFEKLFGKIPDEQERKAFKSFVGLLKLIKKYHADKAKDIRDAFSTQLWGASPEKLLAKETPDDFKSGAQALERDHWDIDLNVKMSAFQKMEEEFPEIALTKEQKEHIIYIYYGEDGEAYRRLRGPGRADSITG